MTRTLILAFLSISLVASIISRPDEAFQASLQGLTVWWNIVFPGLLPFLSLMELMLAFGAVHGIGALLEPLMRRLFRLPGEAGFALALGWTAGFPSGAETTAALRRRGAVSRAEGQRLLSLSHMPSPLFMLLVIGAGFMRRPEVGATIAASVWIAALIAGLIQARFVPGAALMVQSDVRLSRVPSRSSGGGALPLLRRAAAAMADARRRDGRTFGKTLGDAVTLSVYKLMAIGGFMMIGAVLVRIIEPLVPESLPGFLLSGLIESHIGAYSAAVMPMPGGPAWNAAAIAAILSWGGISALLQAGSAVSGTDLSIRPLAAMRAVQSALAFALTLAVWGPLTSALARVMPTVAPVLRQYDGAAVSPPPGGIIRAGDLHSLWPAMPYNLLIFGGALLLLTLISLGSSNRLKR
ncbi:nucleoside recognition domain-containing protein [Paenibacillus sp. sptzw28]|uniref:nucleoside recognition domain-containing protein n=1 Tax=Paenibacillus sp. sptzw28 TaxID=715179 RepID=UPI001C6DDC8F|nr:nucleoside recognition domain-containing protein [Paenibacillus sp. sptzw28]QYR19817.1 nucleoside recognition domain-containing protein [Paenibacillus sp. sptzw28]